MKRFLLSTAVVLLSSSYSLGLDNPSSTKYDERVKFVTYNEEDVVQLDIVAGVTTHIKLDEKEKIQTYALGDPNTYQVAYTGGYHILIRPVADNVADTNFVVITDKRSYNIRLSLKPDREGAVYALTFKYKTAIDKSIIEKAFVQKNIVQNVNYYVSQPKATVGKINIIPISVWDDGEFTFFKFPKGTELPAIYSVEGKNDETIVNYNVEENGTVMKVHKVGERFWLRKGKQVISILNGSYGQTGKPTTTGTSSPAVKRVVKGG